MDIRQRLWTEMQHAKQSQQYVIGLIRLQKEIVKWSNGIILAFSGSGVVMGWNIWKDLPLASCVIISAISLFKAIGPTYIPTEKNVEKLCAINAFYAVYFNKLERLWYDLYTTQLNSKQVADKFFEIQATTLEINQAVIENIKGKNKRLLNEAVKEKNSYFQTVYNIDK